MDDQGLQWWQQLGAHEVDEFNAWLDGIGERGDELEKQVEQAESERDFEREERLIRSTEND